MSFFFILLTCLLAFEKVIVTSCIDTQLVPFGDILVELDPGNRFRLRYYRHIKRKRYEYKRGLEFSNLHTSRISNVALC
jgi:hypothetical protein